MISWQQLEQFVKSTIRVVKRGKREQAAFAVAALCFSGGFVLGGKLLPEFKDESKWIAWLQAALYALGAIAFVYGAIRLWRLVNPAELPSAKDRPSAIKGPMAFTEADGLLFRKLGRESELQKLLGLMLDDQVLMVVVRGASGAGKTSLLRAGLKHILGERVAYHYWEAVPNEPDKGLLRAIQEKWPDGAAKPASLDELVNPVEALGRQSHVIVLDQFEQLRGSRKIFQLLRRISREAKPPHRITWVIAFRREFSADWLDFISPEQERGVRPPQDVSLQLFTAEQARAVIGQLVHESNLKDSIEQSVIDNLIEAATVEGEVSPVDIGIGLLVLAELHERQSGQTITIRDYQFAGGAEGLLTQYISRCLELFPKESQEGILKAMLALRDPEENRQRLATGLTSETLAVEVGMDMRVLKSQLNRLADRDIRLLETETPADGSEMRYRLPHERLIPALYRLTGKLLAEVDQARLKFQNAFQAWRINDKRRHYLLNRKELRLAERYETQIPWGNDEQEKKNFLYRSKRQRGLIRGTTVAVGFALIALAWVLALQYQRSENRKYLRDESGYPPELSDYQQQLKKLDLTEDLNLDRFVWLSSDSVEELSLETASSSNSIAGLSSLSKCHSLKKLGINLNDSQVSNLQPLSKLSNLTHLALHLPASQVSNLEPLTQLSNLRHLTLYLSSQVSNLEPLTKLSNLTHLTLYLPDSQVSSLEPLTQLNNLTQVDLALNASQMSTNLGSLTKLSNRTQLRLALSASQMSDLALLAKLSNLTQLRLSLIASQVSNLEPLSKLSNLTQLTLDLRRSQVSNLEPLSKLSNLTQLTLNLSDSQVNNLELLTKLSNLTQLTLDLSDSQVTYLETLAKLSNLTQLTLALNNSQVSNLEPLAKLSNLTQLTLDLRDSQVSNLEPLSKLSNLTQLTLDLRDSQMSNLEPLSKLSNLTQLTLDLRDSQMSNLEPLSKLSNLTQLTLDLIASQVSNLEPLSKLSNLTQLTLALGPGQVNNFELLTKLSNLTQLTLDLSFSQVTNLEPLPKLSNLTQLTLALHNSQVTNLEPLSKLSNLTQLRLDLNDSHVSNLEPLAKLSRLQTLSVNNATRTQRMSLREIPPSLVELRF
jgi:internalin A